ncbi:lytic transglycosylase domain-containing protein [Amycolatopsis cynarae]|uniref:Lytic transglycosylase domain-containing protein n=1 Tax=Amycolatopsis cynarae TaxID=2995223 RepID=A0ABY7AVF3_9PSEU|nr:lytic transglycosylase domain-containing protein [Amycolatopsis sp. HUAS 11-8]WAL63964.1 lytic transglycosylase domain-containing protein [Amycolatopsis sp. HUAS 11-8]
MRRRSAILPASFLLACLAVLAGLSLLLGRPPGQAPAMVPVAAPVPRSPAEETPARRAHAVPPAPDPRETPAPPGAAAPAAVTAVLVSGPLATVLPGGLPDVAFAAYRSAAAILAGTSPRCGLNWSTLAAIGRVESDHGRYGGSRLYSDGTVAPAIRGVVLDGSAGTARIGDTDGGGFDGDRVFDRAVGPMQFIPSTWRAYASDGNGDGRADPDNIFDAALAAARYLCAGGEDLGNPDGLRAAVLRYNHSQSYVDMVVALDASYRAGAAPVVVVPVTAQKAPTGAVSPVPVPVPPAGTPSSPSGTSEPSPATTSTTPSATPTPSTGAAGSSASSPTYPSTRPSTTSSTAASATTTRPSGPSSTRPPG